MKIRAIKDTPIVATWLTTGDGSLSSFSILNVPSCFSDATTDIQIDWHAAEQRCLHEFTVFIKAHI
jgi:hypothetical protein